MRIASKWSAGIRYHESVALHLITSIGDPTHRREATTLLFDAIFGEGVSRGGRKPSSVRAAVMSPGHWDHLAASCGRCLSSFFAAAFLEEKGQWRRALEHPDSVPILGCWDIPHSDSITSPPPDDRPLTYSE
eukprot:Polyplicarium_translucidae@DN4963_c0_g1_i1.p1